MVTAAACRSVSTLPGSIVDRIVAFVAITKWTWGGARSFSEFLCGRNGVVSYLQHEAVPNCRVRVKLHREQDCRSC